MSDNLYFNMDIPDPDVIFHDGFYYLITTTMHFFPGGEILRSKDLKKWEHWSYVFEKLDSTDAQRLEGDAHVYGKGMWAPALRFHDGKFYVAFSCNDTQKTYLYRATDLKGPWARNVIEGFYHDLSLLFDGGSAYLVYGNTDIHLTELNDEMTAPKEGGLDRVIVLDKTGALLGYEGSHIYKINGKYYLFMIHSLSEKWRRVEAMFVAESLDGEFVGGDIYDEDLGIRDSGIAQGGVVEGPLGWHMIMFQDSGAIGRIPVAVPFTWENGKPKFESKSVVNCDMTALYGSDDFKSGMKDIWQFNHEPKTELIKFDNGYHITTDKVVRNICHARNTITQKTYGPKCSATVTIDGADLNDGDVACLSAFQGDYALVGIKKDAGKFYATMITNTSKGGIWDLTEEEGVEEVYVELEGTKVTVTVECDFTVDKAICYLGDRKLGEHDIRFRLDHFTGARFALACFSTRMTGGTAVFTDFKR